MNARCKRSGSLPGGIHPPLLGTLWHTKAVQKYRWTQVSNRHNGMRYLRRRRRRLHAAGKQSHRFPEADPGGKLRTTKTTEATKREGKRRTKAETKLRQQGKKEEREEDQEKRTGGNRKTKRERNGTREKTKHLETKGRKEKQEGTNKRGPRKQNPGTKKPNYLRAGKER